MSVDACLCIKTTQWSYENLLHPWTLLSDTFGGPIDSGRNYSQDEILEMVSKSKIPSWYKELISNKIKSVKNVQYVRLVSEHDIADVFCTDEDAAAALEKLFKKDNFIGFIRRE